MSAAVDRILVALDERVSRVRVRLAVALTAELQESTPVDTGWARANWIPNIGGPASGPVGTPEAPPTGAQAAALTALASAAASSGIQIGIQPIHVTNRVPYIQRLNDGSSTQAPSGFVQTAISRALDIVIAGGGK